MRGVNANYDIHKKFQLSIKETLTECRKALFKLEINASSVPMFEKKDQQICAILKRTAEEPIDEIKYH